MNVPEKLINYRVYQDGQDLLGMADITLPSFSAMTETIKGAGLAGEVDSPVLGHYGSMELQINWRTIIKSNLNLAAPKGIHLDLRGAQQHWDSTSGNYVIVPVKVVVHCVPKTTELGKFDAGTTTDTSNTFEVYYIKVTVNNKELIELDKYNYICKVGGVDVLGEVRDALGLT